MVPGSDSAEVLLLEQVAQHVDQLLGLKSLIHRQVRSDDEDHDEDGDMIFLGL